MFNYSIVIRTLGNTGEKYRQMLQAISNQTIQPSEVIVVIPYGHKPDHQLGYERIVYSDKGMVTQRAVGIREAQNDYLLVLDDDLDFPPDFAEQLHHTLQERKLDCVLAYGDGIKKDSSHTIHQLSNILQGLKRMKLAFTGQAFYSQKQSEWFDTIASTGGHRTFVNCEQGLCQTGAFACFFIKGDKAKAVSFEDERWLEQGAISSYAAYDDAVFYYKLFLQGGRIAYTQTTDFTHLDAAAGRPASSALTAKRNRLYTIARNRTIFWYRHIWSNHRSLHNLLGGIYGIVNYAIYNIIINLFPNRWSAIRAMVHGYRDAFRYIRNK